jgi:hypothetical protein
MTTTDFKPKQRADRDVTTFTEFTGLRNDTTPERLARTDLVVANNVVLDDDRAASRRAGATLRLLGAMHSLWGDAFGAFVASGMSLYSLDANLTPTLLTNSLSGAPLAYTRAGGQVYFSNGHDTGAVLASSMRTWGIAVPPVLVTPTSGDLVPGRYLVTATYLRADGQESGAPGAQVVDVAAGGGIVVTVPASTDGTVTNTRVYMTPPNSEVLYHVGTVVDGATFTPNAAAIAAMNEPLETQFMTPPPAGQLLAYYKGRVYVAVGDTLYMSEPFAYELFDLRNNLVLDGPITMLAPIEDTGASGFFIGTTNSTGVLLGESPDDFKYVQRCDYGVVQGALAYVDGTLFMEGSTGARRLPMWVSRAGLCVGLPSLDVNNLTRERYTFDTGPAGAAMYDPVTNQFVGVSGVPAAIVMNTQTLTLTTFTEYGYNSFTRAFDRNLGANSNGLFELVGNDDNGLPINATLTLPTTDFGSSFVKVLERLFVGYRSQADMVVRIITDDNEAVIYPLPVSSQPGLATQRVKVGKGLAGRYWQITINNLDGTDFTLDTVDAKPIKLERRINGRA